MRSAVASGARAAPWAAELVRQLVARRRGLVRRPSTRTQRWLIVVLLLAVALGAVYMLWFRDSALVRVRSVTVTGLSGTDAPRERAAVIAAAQRMTTLHVDEDALRRALGAGATVEAIRVTTDFPHGLRIEVVEKAPVAVLVYGSERVAVGSGGVLLPGIRPIPRALPSIQVGALPSGAALGRGRASRLVAAAAAAPRPLRPRILSFRELPARGLVADLRRGPQVILGSPAELTAKWTAAAAILADPTSRGASYIDVRLPDRPVAGGLAVAPPPPDMQAGAAATVGPPTVAGAAAAAAGSATAAPSTAGAAAGRASSGQAGAGAPAQTQAPAQAAGGTTPPAGAGSGAGTSAGTGGAAPHAGP